MEKKAPKPLLGQILEKIAPCIGAKVLMEPTWGIVGRITFRNGKNSYFRYSTLDINRVGAAEISKDKDYANFFLADLGYPVIPGEAFYSDDWAEKVGSDRTIDMACKYAGRIGWPVVVKPNSGSQGRDVQLVFDKPSLRTALSAVFKKDRVALVQQQVKGRDYRVVVLDDKVISAYERIPLSVTGDGVSSVRELLDHKQESFVASSRDTVIQFDDPRFAATLERGERDFSTVPMKDEVVFLLDNANLSSGGDAID
ncbi:MAG: cyanophycin synthetase, partial [Candidatus Paceibacterota bacterium]